VRKMGKSWKRAIVQSSISGWQYRVLAELGDGKLLARRKWNFFSKRVVLEKEFCEVMNPFGFIR